MALKAHKVSNVQPRVDAKVEADDWFEPSIVIEVIASEITLSPIYTAGLNIIREGGGFALRFPKFTGKIRDDKSPENSTTVQECYWKCIRSKQDIWYAETPEGRAITLVSCRLIGLIIKQVPNKKRTTRRKKKQNSLG